MKTQPEPISTVKTDDLKYWIALSRAPQPQLKLQILATYLNQTDQCIDQTTYHCSNLTSDDIKALFHANPTRWKRANLSDSQIAYLKSPPWKTIEHSIALANQHHWLIITLSDPRYPPLLKNIADPPPILWINGNVNLLHQPQLAIVGSRNPTHEGLDNAYQFAKSCSDQALLITSGLARGIDAASHRGALASLNPYTIAVMATGLDQIYPRSNTQLANQIIEQHGALVTEFVPKTKPLAYHFPRRNRIISGLTLGTLVVEAALKSGSLITAHLALDSNRDVFTIPSSIHNPLGKGCHQLLQQGAKLVEKVDDIFTEFADQLPKLPQIDKKQTKNCLTSTDSLDKDQIFLLKCLDYQPTPVDKIIARSGFAATKVATLLTNLELQGWIKCGVKGYRRQTEHLSE